MKTPVAFIIFNRPDTTKRVFEAIRQAKPPKLLVIADGPRADRLGEAEKCAAARAIIEGVDWECEVLTNYSDVNLGCKIRVSGGLDWVFSEVEEAIILEDDCLPDPSFFPFCEELLERYRDDTRIAVISGQNNLFGYRSSPYSYYFSKHPYIWGWATWRRAWKYYDVEMSLWTEIKNGNCIDNILPSKKAVKCWEKIFQNTYDGKAETVWDYRWTFACLINNFLCITSNVNLISNIGFGESSTHTKDSDNKFSNLPTQEVTFPLKHPPFVIHDKKADILAYETIFGAAPLIDRIKRK
ncbi:MAG: glycosyltransferase family 2 protein, partial [Dolichospermum sp.]